MIHIAKHKNTLVKFCIPEVEEGSINDVSFKMQIGILKNNEILVEKDGELLISTGPPYENVLFSFVPADVAPLKENLLGYYDYVLLGGAEGADSVLDRGTVVVQSSFLTE